MLVPRPRTRQSQLGARAYRSLSPRNLARGNTRSAALTERLLALTDEFVEPGSGPRAPPSARVQLAYLNTIAAAGTSASAIALEIQLAANLDTKPRPAHRDRWHRVLALVRRLALPRSLARAEPGPGRARYRGDHRYPVLELERSARCDHSLPRARPRREPQLSVAT